jgi:hypothetical protein
MILHSFVYTLKKQRISVSETLETMLQITAAIQKASLSRYVPPYLQVLRLQVHVHVMDVVISLKRHWKISDVILM